MRQSIIERAPPAAGGGVLFLLLLGKQILSIKSSIVILSCTALMALIAGVAAMILCRKNGFRAIIVKMLLVVFGFFGVFTSINVASFINERSYTGIPLKSIQSVNVLLISDPKRISNGNWVVEGKLIHSEREDITCLSDGRITVFSKGDFSSMGKGRYVTFTGSMKAKKSLVGTPKGMPSNYVFFATEFRAEDWKYDWYKIRHSIFAELEERLFSGNYESGLFLTAMLLGRKADPGSTLIRYFRQSGCIHILALSGLHVGLIAFMLRALLKPLTGFISASLLSAGGAVFFLFFIGLRPSLIRAVLMYVLYTYDVLRGYKITPIKYLAAVFILQSLMFPLSVFELSFTLSYTALAGLLVCGTAYYRLLSRFISLKLSAVLGAGMGAQLTTLPLVVSSFGIWYPVGIIAAPPLTTLSSMAMALGFLKMIFTRHSVAGNMISRIVDGLVNLISRIAEFFSRLPGAEIPTIISWLIASVGTILPIIIIRSIQHEHPSHPQPRFPNLHPGFPESQETVTTKTLGTELSD